MRLLRDARGVEGLPVVLIIGAVLGACVLGLGVRGLTNVQNITDRQRAIESFNSPVERARRVSFGGPGSWQYVELELPDSKILGNGRILQLLINGEVRKAGVLPLPVLVDGQSAFEINSGCYGCYIIELHRISIELHRISHDLARRDNSLHVGEFYLRLQPCP